MVVVAVNSSKRAGSDLGLLPPRQTPSHQGSRVASGPGERSHLASISVTAGTRNVSLAIFKAREDRVQPLECRVLWG